MNHLNYCETEPGFNNFHGHSDNSFWWLKLHNILMRMFSCVPLFCFKSRIWFGSNSASWGTLLSPIWCRVGRNTNETRFGESRLNTLIVGSKYIYHSHGQDFSKTLADSLLPVMLPLKQTGLTQVEWIIHCLRVELGEGAPKMVGFPVVLCGARCLSRYLEVSPPKHLK